MDYRHSFWDQSVLGLDGMEFTTSLVGLLHWPESDGTYTQE